MYEIPAAIAAVAAAVIFLFARGIRAGRATEVKKAVEQQLKQQTAAAEEIRRVTNVVSGVRTEILVTPGASSDEVARNVGDALKKDPKSLQGRLGAMARDVNKDFI